MHPLFATRPLLLSDFLAKARLEMAIILLLSVLQVWALALDPAETRLVVGTAEQQLHAYTIHKPAAEVQVLLANGSGPSAKKAKKKGKRKAQDDDPELVAAAAEADTVNRGGPAGSSNDLLHELGNHSPRIQMSHFARIVEGMSR